MKTTDLWIPDDVQVSMDKGHEFENYVAQLFQINNKYFSIVEWTTDHSLKRNGIKVESDSKPDLVMRHKPTNEVFAVECKWRANPIYNKEIREYVLKWAEAYQIHKYQIYARTTHIPVFIVIGLAGKPKDPEYVFCLPLREARYPELYPSILNKYLRIPPNKPFYWDVKNKKLS